MSNRPVSTLRRLAGADLGTCLNFATNSSDLVVIPAATGMQVRGSYTITFWCNQRSTGTAGAGRVFESAGLNLLFTGTNAVQIGNNGSGKASGTNIFDKLKWTLIGIDYDGANHVFYKNGSFWSTTSQTTNPFQVGDLNVGNSSGGTRSMDGFLDDLRIYKDRVLTPREHALLFQGGNPEDTGLGLWLKFDEGSGSAVVDSSGHAANGTITGATFSTNVAMGAGSI